MSGRPRLLAVHAGAIGDFIVALPALTRLARMGELTVMGHGERIALAPLAIPGVGLKSLESAAFHSVFGEPADALRETVSEIGAALVWFRDADGAIVKGLHAAGAAHVCALPGVPDAAWEAHAVDYYHDCVDRFAAQAGLEAAATERPAYPVLQATPDGPGGVIIHPGSGSAKKNWPLDDFVALAEGLEAEGHSIAWLLGPAEEGWGLPADAAVLPPSSLPRLVEILAGATLFIGNDSGMAHLAAAAAGCPTLALFTTSNPRVWAPRGRAAQALGGHGATPTVDQALARARAMVLPACP